MEGTTQYVDGSHLGGSDGSPASPWTTVGEAVAVAAPGVTVAIAAGGYTEDVRVEFGDLGGNLCACGGQEPGVCKVESAGLVPPNALE